MLLRPTNLLVLDEPTNHLDMQSKDVLLDALLQFTGTVIFVSHDRYFIDRLANRVVELSPDEAEYAPSRMRVYPGNYEYYLYRCAQLHPEVAANERDAKAAPTSVQTSEASTTKKGFEDEKRRKSQLRKLRREEEEIMVSLEALEAEETAMQHELSRPDVYVDGEQVRRISSLMAATKSRHASLTSRWEELSHQIEQAEEDLARS